MERKRRVCATSVGGVKIPPRRRYKPQKWLILRFAIEGPIPSKKNERIPSRNARAMHQIMQSFYGKPFTKAMEKQIFDASKPYLRHAQEFREWETAKRADLVRQAAAWKESYQAHGLTFPITHCRISIYHYWKDHIVRDNSNKAETINDMFVDAGIISSDGAHCRRGGDDEAEVYKGEILNHITLITITAYQW